MVEKLKDQSNLSLPAKIKFEVGGRNANALRVPLRNRLKLLKFYSKMFAQVAGGATSLDDNGQPNIPWAQLFTRLPGLLDVLMEEYLEIISECTDIDPKWAEAELGIEDLWTIIEKVADVNDIQKAFTTAQEATGPKKKDVKETPTGSSDLSES